MNPCTRHRAANILPTFTPSRKLNPHRPSPRQHLPRCPNGFIDLGAEEVEALLRGTIAPDVWQSLLARAGELLDQ
jgi:hypothetical protein